MFNWFRRAIGNVVPRSPAGRAAGTTAISLILMFAFAEAGHYARTGRPFLERLELIFILFASIPALVYGIVHFWGEESESLCPEIDKAWKAGIDALEKVGISLSEGTEPLFLVLGSGSIEHAFVDSMQESGQTFRVKGIPGGDDLDTSLRWYATDSAIYLFSSNVGSLATLVRRWANCSHEQPVDWGKSLNMGKITLQMPVHAVRNHGETVDLSELEESSVSQLTMDVPELNAPQPDVRMPTDIDVAEHTERLQYLCRLVKKARWPRCGLNGAIVLLPFEMAVARQNELATLVDSIRIDTRVIHKTLWLRYPVTGVLVGMEQAVGFNEFAKSIGDRKSLEMRLGSSFSVYRWATVERLQWLCDRIGDSFEDFVYALFKRTSGIANPAENRKLYHLLCRVRQQIKPQLNRVLGHAFGKSGSVNHEGEPALDDGRPMNYFSGCYLAATGRSETEGQSFIKGILFDKLVDEQGKVEWTAEARRAHHRLKLAVWTGWAAVLIDLIVLAYLLLRR